MSVPPYFVITFSIDYMQEEDKKLSKNIYLCHSIVIQILQYVKMLISVYLFT